MTDNVHEQAVNEAKEIVNYLSTVRFSLNWETQDELSSLISKALEAHLVRIEELEAIETVLRRNLENAYNKAMMIYPEFAWGGFTQTAEIIVMALHDKIKIMKDRNYLLEKTEQSILDLSHPNIKLYRDENASLRESLKAAFKCLDGMFVGFKKENMFPESMPILGNVLNIIKSKHPEIFGEK